MKPKQFTCSSKQHIGVSFHSSPQIATSFVRTSSAGTSALPLSGQGNCGPKKFSLPQFPLMAHRPASCICVKPSSAARIGILDVATKRSRRRRRLALQSVMPGVGCNGGRADARSKERNRSYTQTLIKDALDE